jgi:hypothetical protein
MRRFECWLVVLSACGVPSPLIICHNGNCDSAAAGGDDSPAALAASLALRYRGRPVTDGVEIDLRWDARSDRCAFAHDSEQRQHGIDEVGDVLEAHVATDTPAFGERFHVVIELKVDDATDVPALVACARALADRVVAAAVSPLTVIFDSLEPDALRELVERPDWDATPAHGVRFLLTASFVPSPFALAPLSEFPDGLDVVTVHRRNVLDTQVRALRAGGLGLLIWERRTTRELLESVERFDPEYVTTNEPVRLRQWIEAR